MVPPGIVPQGQFVISQAGRDIGQIYVAMANRRSSWLLVKIRTAAKPKTKNVRHVKLMRSIAQDVAHKL